MATNAITWNRWAPPILIAVVTAFLAVAGMKYFLASRARARTAS